MDRRIAGALCAFALLTNAEAQNQTSSPLSILSESAGQYLGAIEWIRAFKAGECGYALKKSFPTLDAALKNDVLPAFAPELRVDIAKQFEQLKPGLLQQANSEVPRMVAAAKQEHDPKTACGLIAGTLAAGVYGRAYENFVANKNAYGWKAK